MVGRGGGDRTHVPDEPFPLKNLIEDFSAAIPSAGPTDHSGLGPSQRAQGQNGGSEESPSSPAYPPCIARGRFRRCTEGFRGDLDYLRNMDNASCVSPFRGCGAHPTLKALGWSIGISRGSRRHGEDAAGSRLRRMTEAIRETEQRLQLSFIIAGKKASAAAAEAGLSASSIPTLLVEGDDKPGLGFAIAQAIAWARVNMTFFVAQSMKQSLVRAGILR